MYDSKRYTVIHSPRLGRDPYYVQDQHHAKIADPIDFSAMQTRRLHSNADRVEHGGARVSIFYRFVETAVQHALELNIADKQQREASYFHCALREV